METAILDFTDYDAMIIENEKTGKVIVKITQDEITIEDGYIATMIPRGVYYAKAD